MFGTILPEPMIGEIKMFGGNYAPTGWTYCNGDLLTISQNSELFSILGTTFGGDGREKFKVPQIPPMKIPIPEKEPEKKSTESHQTDTTNIQSFLEINWIIALKGTFPSRD